VLKPFAQDCLLSATCHLSPVIQPCPMESLTPAQRQALYIQAAERTGIHQPLLAALDQAQNQPLLLGGETGLGVSPANRISLNQVNTFASQVQYAANTVRSLTHHLINVGWKAADLWNAEKGCYTDQLISTIAAGYTAPANDSTAAILESCNAQALRQAYQANLAADSKAGNLPTGGADLDKALLTLLKQLPHSDVALPFQRNALLDMIRIWLQLDDREAALAAIELQPPTSAAIATSEFAFDPALLKFVSRLVANYSGYPHQREALLRLTQRWRQLDSREATIASLKKSTTLETELKLVDSALIALIQSLPQRYQAKGEQRNALVEGFRLWQQLETRSAALVALGVNPEIFTATDPQQSDLQAAAIQLDRALLDFIRQVPIIYKTLDHQREALLHLTQLWRGIATREQTIAALFEDLKRMQRANRGSQDAPPAPTPMILPASPDRWTPDNIQFHAAILPAGSFTWAEATHGGTRMPPNQATVDAIVQIAHLAQQVNDRLGRPLRITNWYQPAAASTTGVSHNRHELGDAIDFYCPGLTGDQLYWFLDPWWVGGLGRYSSFPYLIYIDAGSDWVRWVRSG
jgi:hypothetical protein